MRERGGGLCVIFLTIAWYTHKDIDTHVEALSALAAFTVFLDRLFSFTVFIILHLNSVFNWHIAQCLSVFIV